MVGKDKVSKTSSHDDDDEMTIDFSKITNIFKRKKNSEKKDLDLKEEKEEKEVKKKENKSDEDSDEINFNSDSMKKIGGFFAKYWPYFLIIIPIFLTIFIRAQTVNLTITDDWARSSVENYYRNQILQQIKAQNPTIPDANLQSLANENYAQFAKQNSLQMEEQIKVTSEQFKQYFQYQSGSTSYTYMGDIDSYYFLRMARNLEEKGHVCDVIEDGKCYDSYTLAPLKLEVSNTLHPFSIVYLYKIVKPFNPDFTLMEAQLWVPTVYAVIIAALVFLMMLKMFGPLAGLTSSILISVNPIFLTRSLGSDTDIYNIFFPVLVMFFAFEAFTSIGWKKRAVFATLTGLAMGAYSFAWIGWWYLFYFITIALIGDYIIHLLKEYRKNRKFDLKHAIHDKKAIDMIAILVPLIIVSLISVILVTGTNPVKILIDSPFGFIKTKVASNPTLWPNVLTTVAEFNESSIPGIIGQMGGKWIFFFALLGYILIIFGDYKRVAKNIVLFLLATGILYYLVGTASGTSLKPIAYLMLLFVPFLIGAVLAFKSDEDSDLKLSIMFFLWAAASIFAALKGVRFTLLLVPPIAIGVGITFGYLHEVFSKLIANGLNVKKTFVSLVIFLLFAWYLVNPVRGGIATGKGYVPNVNDQWWDALTKIKDNSQPDAIINSWWDFGHWFKYISDRRVTLDGSSQNNPQLHWLGRALLTSNEDDARGILKMLDCGGNEAFNTIDKKLNDIPKSVKLLNAMILIDMENAKKMLFANGFSDTEAEKVLQLSHCNPPENYFITSEDMIGKGGVWAHFGSWSFDRAWMHAVYDKSGSESKAVSQYMKELNMTKETASVYASQIRNLKNDNEVNVWIAPWPSYMQGETPCQAKNETVICQIQQVNVVINLTTMDAVMMTSQGLKRPNNFVYTTPTGIAKKVYDKDQAGFGMVLLITKSGYSSMFMAPELTDSMFTRLFFMDGHGIKNFDLFSDTTGMNGFKISVWKANWQGNSAPIIVDRYNITNAYLKN